MWLVRPRALLLLIPAASLVGGAASASNCPAADPDHSILGCTLIIDDPATNSSESAMAYYNRGHAYLVEHNIGGAISDLTRAISLNTELAQAYDERASAYLAEGQYDLAIQDETEAIRLKPDSAAYYYNRGNDYLQKHELAAAAEDYSSAIKLKPDFALAFMNRGIAAGQAGQLAESIDDLSEAIRLDAEQCRRVSQSRHRLRAITDLRSRDLGFQRGHSLQPRSRQGLQLSRQCLSRAGAARACGCGFAPRARTRSDR